ncbi:ATP-binding cassette domain-containing protein [Eubacterium callanderi]
MNSFDEKTKTRIRNENESFENAFYKLSSVVMDNSSLKGLSLSEKSKNAIEEILHYYGQSVHDLPKELTNFNDQLDYLLRPTGVMKRQVTLSGHWWQNAVSPMLTLTAEGNPIALIPNKTRGYSYRDHKTGKKIRISAKNAGIVGAECYCFYNPLPLKSLSVKDLLIYMIKSLSPFDFIYLAVVTLIATLMGLIMPYYNQRIFSYIIPYGLSENLFPIFLMILGVVFSTLLINSSKGLLESRIQVKLGVFVESASMQRLLSLPASFFRNYTSGALSFRMNAMGELANTLTSTLLVSGLSALFSCVYFFQISGIAPALLPSTILIIGTTLFFTLLSTLLQLNLTRKKMAITSKLSGLVYSLFSGIQKIKLVGAERRAFSKWAEEYQQKAEYTYNPPAVIKVLPVITKALPFAGSILLYWAAGRNGVLTADYMAFNVSYGLLSGAIMSIANLVSSFVSIKPTLEMVQPLLATAPEIVADKHQLTHISGKIELSNVSFGYQEEGPLILNNISLKIEPGQCVGIVGKTGCGKSTLMRLLLGFEAPQVGAVYYDNYNLNTLDLKTLRRSIGVVTQDGRLFSGDIYANIVISAPHLSVEDAWNAARLAGLDQDIRTMPMGMHTLVTEGGSDISGGQKQRLMIARALAPGPSVLMLDEATSALDNLTQKIVTEAVDSLNIT